MQIMRHWLAIAAAFWSISPMVLEAQSGPASTDTSGSLLVRYASNLTAGDSVIHITNNGINSTAAGVDGTMQNGSLCANVYTYSPDEQMVSCCTCAVTPNALVSFSVTRDLVSNPLTPVVPQSAVIKIVASLGADTIGCNAATVAQTTATKTVPGLHAWGTTLHAAPGGVYGMTETAFSVGALSPAEVNRMTQLCGFIKANGSGYGICKNCRFGGLGAEAK
jgi:hypothetical protein